VGTILYSLLYYLKTIGTLPIRIRTSGFTGPFYSKTLSIFASCAKTTK